MNEKSHVSLEQHVCLVCGSAFETGSILLDKRLRASMERHTTTGCGLCPEHRRFADDGFIALIECDPERSAVAAHTDRMKTEHAYRTGHVAHLWREVVAKLFDVPLESCQDCVFVEVGLIDQLESLLKREAT